MAFSRFALACGGLAVLVQLLSLVGLTSAANVAVYKNDKYVETTSNDGKSLWLRDTRKPSLYTQNFGDCDGNSLINVTRFDAAYYKDNMTVLFHLEGNTNVANESLMCKQIALKAPSSRLLTGCSVHRRLCLR